MKKYLSIIFTVIAIAGSSCKKTYLGELTNNPNVPSVASPSLLLTGALKTTAGILNGALSNNAPTLINRGIYIEYAVWMGYLSRSTGFQVFANIDQYAFTSSDFDVWQTLYGNLSNYNAIISANAGGNYTGIAKIMTVIDYQQ